MSKGFQDRLKDIIIRYRPASSDLDMQKCLAEILQLILVSFPEEIKAPADEVFPFMIGWNTCLEEVKGKFNL